MLLKVGEFCEKVQDNLAGDLPPQYVPTSMIVQPIGFV